MYDKDTNQRVKPARAGEAIRSADLQKIVALILQTVKGGRGVLVKRVGQSIIIEAEQGKVATGGGGSVNLWRYDETFAGLPAPDAINLFGRVTEGDDQGMTCVVDAAGTGWVPFTHFG